MLSGIKETIKQIAATPEGKAFFHWMMLDCGFRNSSLAFSKDGDFDSTKIIANEVLRRFYLNIRTLIPALHLEEIETMDIKKYYVEKIKIEEINQ